MPHVGTLTTFVRPTKTPQNLISNGNTPKRVLSRGGDAPKRRSLLVVHHAKFTRQDEEMIGSV